MKVEQGSGHIPADTPEISIRSQCAGFGLAGVFCTKTLARCSLLRAERSGHHFKNSPQAHNGRSIKRHIFGKLFCAQRPGDARQMQRHLRERPGLAE
tara:strand:+ start:735 stop:1025 length:291 start_codon:yes stop_codon:yes gene_type:complete